MRFDPYAALACRESLPSDPQAAIWKSEGIPLVHSGSRKGVGVYPNNGVRQYSRADVKQRTVLK
jgi:hypothetical protein